MSDRCPACGSSRSRAAARVREHAFRRCRACGTLFLADRARADTAALYSGESYFGNPAFASPETGGYYGYSDYLADRTAIERKFATVLAHVERLVPPGRLLDVGAGPGFMLTAARTRGWEAAGVELNPWAAAYARDELGVDVRTGTLEEADRDAVSLDAVTMMDLLEHVAEPAALVREAARLLRPGGVLAVLTPDAGAPASRLLRGRWPELQRAPEHLVLLSLQGLVELLASAGFRVRGWAYHGKRSSLATLVSDAAPIAPALLRPLAHRLRGTRLGALTVEVDPRTKVAVYAQRDPAAAGARPVAAGPRRRELARARLPRRPPEESVREDLEKLARARRLCDWMFEQLADGARGHAVEIGAGIGTFSERLLARGVERLLLLEPEPACAEALEGRFAADARVTVAREALPRSPALAARAGRCDFILCQNVIEHVEDDAAAVAAMAEALRPGGRLALLAPAHEPLFNGLDRAYGHHRRYGRERMRDLCAAAGLEVVDLHHFNLAGVAGWLAGGLRPAHGVGTSALAAYDALVPVWRRLEGAAKPPFGLSLVVHAQRA